jgi:K+/H+ antiporter YhaU regulatory subunit KhtT
MLIDEVEAIWEPIAEKDDWTALHAKVAAVRRMGKRWASPRPRAVMLDRLENMVTNFLLGRCR